MPRVSWPARDSSRIPQGLPRTLAGMLTVPIFFLLGGMVASFFVDLPMRRGLRPKYRVPITFIFVVNLCALVLASLSPKDVTLDFFKNYGLMFLLSFSSGLQNAMISNGKNRAVRTTHLTGITTDMAIGFTRILFFYSRRHDPTSNKLSHEELVGCIARGCTILSFALGSFLSAILVIKWGWVGFFLPVTTSIGIGWKIYSE